VHRNLKQAAALPRLCRSEVIMLRVRLGPVAFVAAMLQGQAPKPQPARKSLSAAPTKSKLTPEQKQGLDILRSQAELAKGFAPVMRTFALFEIARGYESIHDSRSMRTLEEAFEASQTIEDETANAGVKRSLQTQIIRRLVCARSGILRSPFGPVVRTGAHDCNYGTGE
jgi:hypothetical protein